MLEESIVKVFSQVMETPVDTIDKDSSPDNIATWDSLKHMNLILALEQEFKVQFNHEEIVEMMNVGLIILTIKEKL